jgi:hypothetical protein
MLVVLTRFSPHPRERLRCGEASEHNMKSEEEVVHSSRLSPKSSLCTETGQPQGACAQGLREEALLQGYRKELGVLAAIQKQATRDKVVVFSVNWQQSAEEFHRSGTP